MRTAQVLGLAVGNRNIWDVVSNLKTNLVAVPYVEEK